MNGYFHVCLAVAFAGLLLMPPILASTQATYPLWTANGTLRFGPFDSRAADTNGSAYPVGSCNENSGVSLLNRDPHDRPIVSNGVGDAVGRDGACSVNSHIGIDGPAWIPGPVNENLRWASGLGATINDVTSIGASNSLERVRLFDVFGGTGVGGRVIDFTANINDGSVASYPLLKQYAAFVDPQLEAAVRDALQIYEGPIPLPSLAGLVQLNAAGRGIEVLDGLEAATGLQSLDLSYNAISSIQSLLDNTGIGSSDVVVLYGNPLSQNVICDDLPELSASGVDIGFDGICGAANTVRVQCFIQDDTTPLEASAVLITQETKVVGTAAVDSNGYFEINGLTEGATYAFECFAQGYIPKKVQLTLGFGIEEITADLDPLLTPPPLSGSIIDATAEANAVAAALVTVSQGGVVIARTVAYANGEFEFHTLPGVFKLDAVALDFTAPSYIGETVIVGLGDTAEVGVVLEKIDLPGSLIGTVVNPQEVPLGNAQVVVQQTPAGFTATRLTTDEGVYSVASVPSGAYEVRAVVKDIGWGMNNGEVQQDHTTIDIELSRDLRSCIAPNAPVGVSASDGTNSSAVDVSWSTVSGTGIEYQVYRGTSANFANALALSDWIAATTFIDTTAAPPSVGSACNGGVSHQYYYWIVARTAANECEGTPSAHDTGYRGEAVNTGLAGASPVRASQAMPFAMVLALLAGLPRRHQGPQSTRRPSIRHPEH